MVTTIVVGWICFGVGMVAGLAIRHGAKEGE